MVPLGTPAPDFTLPDVVFGSPVCLHDVRSHKATVIMFLCNHCPFVQHIIEQVVAVARAYIARGIQFIGISSNDPVQYPDDAPDKMKFEALRYNFPFPYLFDETQDVAKAYQAVCTPEFYVFDAELHCVYRGQFDDARPGNDIPVTGSDLKAALEALLQGSLIAAEQKPSIGCNIKWRTP